MKRVFSSAWEDHDLVRVWLLQPETSGLWSHSVLTPQSSDISKGRMQSWEAWKSLYKGYALSWEHEVKEGNILADIFKSFNRHKINQKLSLPWKMDWRWKFSIIPEMMIGIFITNYSLRGRLIAAGCGCSWWCLILEKKLNVWREEGGRAALAGAS